MGNKSDFGEHATKGGNKRDFGEHATKSGHKTHNISKRTSLNTKRTCDDEDDDDDDEDDDDDDDDDDERYRYDQRLNMFKVRL